MCAVLARNSSAQEESLVVPGNTMFTTFELLSGVRRERGRGCGCSFLGRQVAHGLSVRSRKSSKGRDKPPSWRLLTTSTFRRGAKQERCLAPES